MDTVEVDTSVARLAKDQFGFQEGPRLSLKLQDGVEFVNGQATTGKKYDVVIVDVDNKDASVKMARPSLPFIQSHFVKAVKNNCLTSQGNFLDFNINFNFDSDALCVVQVNSYA